MKKQYRILSSLILILALILCSIVIFTNKKSISPVYGIYRISSNDLMIQRSVLKQDIYFKVNEDHLIVYNTTVNGKPMFNIKGAFTVDHRTNTLNINWFGGKLPKHIRVEQEGEDYFIKIGDTVYKKESSKS